MSTRPCGFTRPVPSARNGSTASMPRFASDCCARSPVGVCSKRTPPERVLGTRRWIQPRCRRIEANDRSGLERLLRYCARPVFALERLRQIDAEHLVYESIKSDHGGSVSLLLTPLERLERLAALIPPPRRHRHRYYGVLAPNAPLRAALTTLAGAQDETPNPAAVTGEVPAAEQGAAVPNTPAEVADEPLHRRAARYVWALLLARIYEVLPLVCPKCGGEMRIIAFITEGPVIREILGHLGEPISPPRLAPARGPPLWEALATGQAERETDPRAQPGPDYEFDQRVA